MADSATGQPIAVEDEEEVPIFESASIPLEGERESDYFLILNLPRDCSSEDVTKAYKRLSRLLHPDRHDASLKEAAERSFQSLAKAHSVLSDPKLRVIYEELGEKGLATNWEVATKQQSPAEVFSPIPIHFSPLMLSHPCLSRSCELSLNDSLASSPHQISKISSNQG